MVVLVAGIAVLVAVMLIGNWFVNTTPSAIVRGAKWTAVLLALAVAALMIATGRLGWALAAMAGLVPWLIRLIQVHHLYRTVRRAFPGMVGSSSGGESRSIVRTRFLAMTLDHDSRELSGTVCDGPLQGRSLNQLSFDEAMDLRRHCAADPQSAQLLETWLDRIWPDWRDRSHPVSQPAGAAMTEEEALSILGLAPGAGEEEIRAAHRRLMGRMHPDHGGSDYLAMKINLARDLLLAMQPKNDGLL